MNKRVVVAIAGSAGLAVLVASAAALALTLNPLNPSPVASVEVMTPRTTETQFQKQVRQHLRQAAGNSVAPSVLEIPTVVIYGEVPRHGAAGKPTVMLAATVP